MRLKAFDIKLDESLLNPKHVGVASVNTLVDKMTREVIDVKR